MRTRLSGSSSTVAFTGGPLCQHSPGLPRARGIEFSEEPDDEQDDDDQGEDATADIHRLVLLSLVGLEGTPMYPYRGRSTLRVMRARGLEPLRALRLNGT
jgi:hypothetical protein